MLHRPRRQTSLNFRHARECAAGVPIRLLTVFNNNSSRSTSSTMNVREERES